MATKKRKAPAKRKKDSCAVSLGRKGGRKTKSLGKGIFSSTYKKKRKKAAPKKKRATKRKATKRKRKATQLRLF
jgi:hypothetical protein